MKGKWLFLLLFVVLAALAGPLAAQKMALPGQDREPPAGVQTGSFSPERQPAGASEAPSGETAGQAPGKSTGEGSSQSTSSPARPEAASSTGGGGTGEQNPAGEKSGSSPSAPPGQGGQGGQVSAGSPPQNERESGCPVEVAVVGMNGELLFGPGRVTVTAKNRGGITPLGALDATGLPYTTSARWANFVDSVAGQGNKGQAGWMYSVNGEVPLAAADQKKLNTADKIIWWYSRKINEPAPAWEDLANKK